MFHIEYSMRGNVKVHMYSYVGHIFCIYCQKHENFVEIEIFENKREGINLVDHQVPFWLKNRSAAEVPTQYGIWHSKLKMQIFFDPVTLLLGYYPKEKTTDQPNKCMKIHLKGYILQRYF